MDWAVIVIPAVVAGVVGLLGGGGLMSVFRDRRDAKRETRQEASEIRAEFRTTYEKNIALANELGHEEEANQLRQEFLDFDSRLCSPFSLKVKSPRSHLKTDPWIPRKLPSI